MLHLRKQLLPLIRAASHPAVSPNLHRSLLLFSTSTPSAPFCLDDYLVTACGLTPAQALKASKKAFKEAKSKDLSLSCLGSASSPDAVLALLSQTAGLSRPDIAAVLAADPLLLCASAKDVAPQLAALRDRLGLSAPQIAGFLQVASRALCSRNVLPNLEFLISFYGSLDGVLPVLRRTVMNRTDSVLCYDLETVIRPNVALLTECGLSIRDIVKLSSTAAWVLFFDPERVRSFIQRADELGVPRSSGMFRQAVATVACVSQGKIAAKLELFKSTLGCTDAQIAVAVRKMPDILRRSMESIRCRNEFLINDVGLDPECIVKRPMLLMFSLEKRLAPRHYVLKVLQAKGLLSSYGFSSIAMISDQAFKSKFIHCHEDIVPDLADAYAAACAGKVHSLFQL